MAEEARCPWCVKEVAFLHKAGGFRDKDIKAYTAHYGIFGGEPMSFEDTGFWAGCSAEEAKSAVEEVGTWLAGNSPYRGAYLRCFVCSQTLDGAAA
jgi:hypothetical protein